MPMGDYDVILRDYVDLEQKLGDRLKGWRGPRRYV